MKAIHITLDERLLEKLNNDEEVKQEGRSAVIRRAVADYLRKKRRATIVEAYRRAYGRQPAGVRPVASTIRGLPSKVVIETAEGLKHDSAVNLDHIQNTAGCDIARPDPIFLLPVLTFCRLRHCVPLSPEPQP